MDGFALNVASGVSLKKSSKATARKVIDVALAAAEVEAKKQKATTELEGLTTEALSSWSEWGAAARKSALSFWAAGKALHKLKKFVDANRNLTGISWTAWCEQHKDQLAKSSAEQAIKVAKKLTEKQIEAYDSITAAKVACGIVKVKPHTRLKGTPSESKEVSFKTSGPMGAVETFESVNRLLKSLLSMELSRDDEQLHKLFIEARDKMMELETKVGL
jgi:hypothetical protein